MTNLPDVLWSLLTDPNVAYLLLIIGMWASVLAFLTPGTGLPEAGAVVFLGLAVVSLTHLPVNVAGLALIGLSVALFVLELKVPAHGAFLLGGAIAFGVGSLFLFQPAEGEAPIEVSRWLVAGTSLATIGFFGFALTKVIQSQKAPPAHNPDAVVGAIGEARTSVDGSGSVYVGGELWSARADESIQRGEKVVVVQREGLTLKVARKK
ncbi:MAG: hypothetical protein HY023_12785 [Chloroflexi bacterium]|nr:hypothetical protein [Chloroflexota bacterium]MBI3763362.1 hypothetical protein [Chloroflexota bacterium]